LSALCETYWFPIYAFLRRQGYSTHQAEDCTQEFFATLIEKQGLRLVDSERGRFRSYLLGALKHFLADEYDRKRAQKRGGSREILSMDFIDAETRYSCEPAHELSPERLFQKSWALVLLDRTLKRLREEAAKSKNEPLFDQLKIYLTGGCSSPPYGIIAEELGMTEGAIRTAVHRFRMSYRRLLREEIAQTVSSQDEVEEELKDLFNLFTA
jgi:RNA polymerase sigma-70 factor (ECF subfamily)